MLLRFRCNFVRLKDDLQLLNVPQTCASHGPAYGPDTFIELRRVALINRDMTEDYRVPSRQNRNM